jgi:NAD-dependent dihydropyrimidine dehydrogenase PreA subunit
VAEDHKTEVQDKAQDKVHIYKRWCKACEICVEFCPRKALAMGEDGYPELAFPERCNLCGLCQYRCPDFAVAVPALNQGKKRKKEEASG